jgi:hypothetical protein
MPYCNPKNALCDLSKWNYLKVVKKKVGEEMRRLRDED